MLEPYLDWSPNNLSSMLMPDQYFDSRAKAFLRAGAYWGEFRRGNTYD
jgi:hypothetical protein